METTIICKSCGYKITRRYVGSSYTENTECPECCSLSLEFEDGCSRSDITTVDKALAMMQTGHRPDYAALAESLLEAIDTDDEQLHKIGYYMLDAYLRNDVDALCTAVCGWSLDTLMNRMEQKSIDVDDAQESA